MRTPENLVRHELIGLQVKIADSTNEQIRGLQGKVIDESRNTFVLETVHGEKTVIKEECIFSFRLDEVSVRIDGKLLVARPEDRIKKKLKKW